MSGRHKVFVSYHHANDENYKQVFNHRFGNKFGVLVRGSVELGEIDPQSNADTIRRRIRDDYLRDSSVTVVLVGVDTWKRKHVDWEIYSSLRATEFNPRSGLLGILLPSYTERHPWGVERSTIPPRLQDNVDAGFAELQPWSDDPDEVQGWIHEAYLRKGRIQPNNVRPMFARNRTGPGWTD